METSFLQFASLIALAVAAIASLVSAIACRVWNKEFFQNGVGSHGMAFKLGRLHHVARYALAAFCAAHLIANFPVGGVAAVACIFVLSRTTRRWGSWAPRLVHQVADRGNVTLALVCLTAALAGVELLDALTASSLVVLGLTFVAGFSLAAVSAAHDDYTLELIRLG